MSSKLVHSPNALTLGKKGDIYVVNDSGKRGSMMEKILKLLLEILIWIEKLF